jgi:hypothetical protein
MVTKESRPIERVISQGKPIFSGKTTAKDFRSWIEHRIGVYTKTNNEEYRQVFMSILNAYNYYEPRKEAQVNANQWKGKSSIEILKEVDKLIIVKYQKETEESEPKEIRTEVSKEELSALVWAIKEVRSKGVEELQTKDIAYQYCYNLGLNDMLQGNNWKNVFSNRPLHNKLTLALNALSQLGFTTYKKGVTKLLDKNLSVQLLLL